MPGNSYTTAFNSVKATSRTPLNPKKLTILSSLGGKKLTIKFRMPRSRRMAASKLAFETGLSQAVRFSKMSRHFLIRKKSSAYLFIELSN